MKPKRDAGQQQHNTGARNHTHTSVSTTTPAVFSSAKAVRLYTRGELWPQNRLCARVPQDVQHTRDAHATYFRTSIQNAESAVRIQIEDNPWCCEV
jgi:hypothetical protein